MCLYPTIIKNPRYRANKKNSGNIPPVRDDRMLYIPVGCGYCMECRRQQGLKWRSRLTEEIKANPGAKFITLTFSNESYTELGKLVKGEGYAKDNAIAKKAMRRFLERWRKKTGKSIKHWFITELGHGNTEHLHLHGVIWEENLEEIEKIWKYGWVWKGKKRREKIINYVSGKTANYITKYMTKVDTDHKFYKPVILSSSGIGKDFVNSPNFKRAKYNGKETKEEYITDQGFKMAMPIYWRNKLYTEEERMELWVNKLDKNERYVGGEKVNADDEKAYYGLLKHYRELNKEYGYGSPEDWDRAEYEYQRRLIKQAERGLK